MRALFHDAPKTLPCSCGLQAGCVQAKADPAGLAAIVGSLRGEENPAEQAALESPKRCRLEEAWR